MSKPAIGDPCQWSDSGGNVTHGRVLEYTDAGTVSTYTVESIYGGTRVVPHWGVHLDGAFNIGRNPFAASEAS